MADVKEPAYFSEGWPHWVTNDDEYRALFDTWQGQQAIGEASTPYFDDPHAPARIKQLITEPCKILISLRNPADRAYSQWEHSHFHESIETLDFETALQAEEERVNQEHKLRELPFYRPQVLLYFRQGLYAEKVRHYIDEFGQEHVLVIIFEDLIAAPQEQFARIFSFLGVDAAFEPVFSRSNPSRTSRIRWLSNFLQSPPAWLGRTYQAMPGAAKQAVFRLARRIYWLNQQSREKGRLDPALRADLLHRYQPSIHELETLLDRDLSIWYDKSALPQRAPHD